MSLYLGDKKCKIYKGDYKPVNLYYGEGTEVTGWTSTEKTGKLMEFDDTYNDKADSVFIMGQSTQFTTTGAQLLNITDGTETKNGITVTRLGGVVMISGTPTSTEGYTAFHVGLVSMSVGTYTMSVDNKVLGIGIAMSAIAAQLHLALADTVVKRTSTISAENNSTIQINVSNTYGAINYTGKFMLNTGSTVLPWEPYTGGIASPNPDYPQPIKGIGEDGIDIRMTGRNLFDNEIELGSIDKDTGIGLTDNTCVRTKRFSKVQGGSTITLSNDKSFQNHVFEYKEDYTFLYRTATIGAITLTLNEDTRYIKVRSGAGQTPLQNDLSVKYMLNFGTIPKPWESYTGALQLLTLSRPLYSVGTASDFLSNGGIYRSIGKVVFDGSADEDIQQTTVSDLYRYSIQLLEGTATGTARKPILSTHFIDGSASGGLNSVGIAFLYSRRIFFYPNQSLDTVEKFRAWLVANPVTVLYPYTGYYPSEESGLDVKELPTYPRYTAVQCSEEISVAMKIVKIDGGW